LPPVFCQGWRRQRATTRNGAMPCAWATSH